MLATLLTAVLAAGPAQESAQASPATKIAVLPLGALGISSDMARNLEMLLRNSIGTIPGFKVLSAVDIQIALRDPKNKAVAECGGGPDCAVAVGKLVDAELALFGTVGTIGQSYALNLRVMNVKTGKEQARQQANLSGNRDLLIPETRLAAYKLVAPERVRGSLLVEIDVAGVEVEIDGESKGVTPLAKPVDNLTPGAHVVVLRRPGYSAFQQEFNIRPFETTRLKLELGKAQP